MLLADILAGALAISYAGALWLSIASYRASGERRIMASAMVFIALLIKDIYVLTLSFEGMAPEIWHFSVDIIGMGIVLVLWKWG